MEIKKETPLMDHFGEYLRRERKLRNISLEEISEATKIGLHLLKALEEVDLDMLPTGVYVKGFLRAYSKYVGLDDNDVVLRYEGYLQDKGKHIESAPEKKEKSSPPKVWIAAAILVVAISTVLLFVLLGPERTTTKSTEEAPPLQEKKTTAGERVLEEKVSKEDAVKEEKPPEILSKAEKEKGPEKPPFETGSVEVPPAKDSLVLAAQVLSETWIRYRIDESPAKEILLQPDESFVWRAKDRLKLIIGNAGGIAFTLNGKPMEPLGKEGEVVRLELPKKTGP